MTSALLDLRDINYTYPGAPPVLTGLSCSFHEGQTAAIVGRSGEGKSTLLSILGLLLGPQSGQYSVQRRDVIGLGEGQLARLRSEFFGFMFQDHLLDETLTLRENLLLPSLILGGPRSRRRNRHRMEELADQVGVADLLHRLPRQVSGGQRQRAAVIRSLVHGPRVVLADEPTGSLDPATASSVFDTLLSLSSELGLALVVVTHDIAMAARCHRVLQLTGGELLGEG